MSDGFEVIEDTANGEGSGSPEESNGQATSRRRLFQLGAAGVAAVGTAAVANALSASPAGATPGSALLVGANNSAGSAVTELSGGNGFLVSTAGSSSLNPAISVEGTSTGSATFGSIGVKGTGLAGVQGVSNGSNTVGTAGVQGVGASWNPGVAATNTGHPSLYLAPISTTTLPTGGGGSKPFPGSFIVLSDGSLHYSNAPGKWVALTGPSTFAAAQGGFCLLSNPIRVLDTRPSNPAAINKGSPISGGTTYGLQVTGESVGGVQVPAGAVAVIGNVTVVNPTAAGYLTLYPGGASRPTTSSINYVAGQVVANGVTMRLGPTGIMNIFAAATTDVIFDATGFIA